MIYSISIQSSFALTLVSSVYFCKFAARIIPLLKNQILSYHLFTTSYSDQSLFSNRFFLSFNSRIHALNVFLPMRLHIPNCNVVTRSCTLLFLSTSAKTSAKTKINIFENLISTLKFGRVLNGKEIHRYRYLE